MNGRQAGLRVPGSTAATRPDLDDEAADQGTPTLRRDQRHAAAQLTRLLDELDPPARDPFAPRCWRCCALDLATLAAGTVTCASLGCETTP